VTLEKLSVALALFLSYLGPFWITLASWRKRRSLPQLELIAVGLILIGESTLLGSETAFRAISWSGVGIALLASIVQAAFISASAHLSQRSKLPVHVLATYQQLIAAIAVWIFAQHFALGLIPAWRPKALLFLLVMSVTLGAAFFPLAFLAQRLTRIVEYALWQTLDPLLATYFVGWLWYHEGSGPFGLIGILLATAGAMLNAYTQQGQNRSP
jgi:drug/metabolite transporter (DMT)-like permease